ncbi:hypothetical protein [Metaclostridioides mangenotii]|uniref:hypothetical protein n=1 Tax=Metaclostridioides mangenotii TaxID=1540 RepID=UPI000466B9D5|nr:hypothetical protein [Clostridioides mangenotii]
MRCRIAICNTFINNINIVESIVIKKRAVYVDEVIVIFSSDGIGEIYLEDIDVVVANELIEK